MLLCLQEVDPSVNSKRRHVFKSNPYATLNRFSNTNRVPNTPLGLPLFLILAVCVAVVGAPSATGAAPAAAARSQQFVELPFPVVSFEMTGEGPVGTIERAWVAVGPSRPGPAGADRFRFGVFESLAGGVDPGFRSASWLATVVAFDVIRADLDDYNIYFDIPDTAGGNSASAAQAVALLAALLGHDLDPAVVITGALLPDGTIGPVAGIREKIEGAAAYGMGTLLLPRANERFASEGETVFDHVAYGRSLGVDVRYVGHIREAYPPFTGETLPAPVVEAAVADVAALAENRPLFDVKSPAAKTIRDIMADWSVYMANVEDDWGDFGAEFQVYVQPLEQAAWEAFEAGRFGAALEQMRAAAALGDLLAHEKLARRYIEEGDFVGLLDFVQESAAKASFMQDLYELAEDGVALHGGHGPAVLEFAATVLNGLGALYTGFTEFYNIVAQYELLDEDYPGVDEIFAYREPIPTDAWDEEWLGMLDEEDVAAIGERLTTALANLRLADWEGRRALDAVDLWTSSRVRAPGLDEVDRLARQRRLAAHALNEYIGAFLITDVAAEYGISPEQYMQHVTNRDRHYAFAHGAGALLASVGNPYALLGAADAVYVELSRFAAEGLLLFVEYDEDGFFVDMAAEETLDELLRAAEDEAVRSIAALRSLGVESVPSLLHLDAARFYKYGDGRSRIEALNRFWRADRLAKTMIQLIVEPTFRPTTKR